MNDDVFNMSVRKYLKKLGVTSQREIERAVLAAVEDGRLKGSERLKVETHLRLKEVDLDLTVDGTIELE